MNNDYLLSMIAKMYYIDKIKQNEIAKRMNLVPMQISRYLKEAEQKGIVAFHVKMPWPLNNELSNEVRKRFKLQDCFVLDIPAGESVPQTLGSFLADYFVQILPDNAIVGLSWGYTISRFVQALPFIKSTNCSLIQLTGAFAGNEPSVTPTQIINEVSKKLDGRIYVINAPLYASSEEMKTQLLSDPANILIHEMAKKSDINIIGLSCLDKDATTFRSEVIQQKDFDELMEKGAAGDLAGTFLDKNGNRLEWSKSKMYTGVPLEIISQGKNVICVAGEKNKAPLLKVVCRKKCFHTLVTTGETALELLK